MEETAADILRAELGAPKQELWMAEHAGKADARIMIGAGGGTCPPTPDSSI